MDIRAGGLACEVYSDYKFVLLLSWFYYTSSKILVAIVLRALSIFLGTLLQLSTSYLSGVRYQNNIMDLETQLSPFSKFYHFLTFMSNLHAALSMWNIEREFFTQPFSILWQCSGQSVSFSAKDRITIKWSIWLVHFIPSLLKPFDRFVMNRLKFKSFSTFKLMQLIMQLNETCRLDVKQSLSYLSAKVIWTIFIVS